MRAVKKSVVACATPLAVFALSLILSVLTACGSKVPPHRFLLQDGRG